MNALTITEDLDASYFICRAHRLSDGLLVGEVMTNVPTADIPSLSNQPIYVVVIPYQGARFVTNHAYAVGDLALPYNTMTTPFYYKRLVAGTSGNTEPAWAVIPAGVCDDNGVSAAWVCIELTPPLVQSPVLLTPESWNGGVVWDGGEAVWDTVISNWTA
jgi:hypothetical protein